MANEVKSWDERSEDVIAQGCLTYSKRSDQFVKGVYPTHVTHGEGCYLYEAGTQKRYIDFIGGLGSNIVCVNNNYSLPTEIEVELAEQIRARIPICEKLRFLKTGSESCLASVRIARAYQQSKDNFRNGLVWGVSYHGWGDIFISAEIPGSGTIPGRYRKFDDIEDMALAIGFEKELPCAIIIEPVQLDCSDKRKSILEAIRIACDSLGIVLIFDEVITGFRTPKYCFANYFGIQPDIICLGKALANGSPLAVVGGKREIMDTPGWFVSSTFAGEVDALLSAWHTLKILDEPTIERLWNTGRKFQEAFNELSPRIQMVGIPTKAVWKAESDEYRALFFQEMCKRGYLLGKAWHIMLAHDKQTIDQFLVDADVVIKLIENNAVGLEGELPQEVFKRY